MHKKIIHVKCVKKPASYSHGCKQLFSDSGSGPSIDHTSDKCAYAPHGCSCLKLVEKLDTMDDECAVKIGEECLILKNNYEVTFLLRFFHHRLALNILTGYHSCLINRLVGRIWRPVDVR